MRSATQESPPLQPQAARPLLFGEGTGGISTARVPPTRDRFGSYVDTLQQMRIQSIPLVITLMSLRVVAVIYRESRDRSMALMELLHGVYG